MLALDPLVTVSVESLKLLANSVDTVAPDGLAVSSFTAVSVAEPLATGASFTAVMVVVIEAVAEEIDVEPPLVVVSTVLRLSVPAVVEKPAA